MTATEKPVVQWTKDKPTEPGLYWVYDEVTKEVEAIRVFLWFTEQSPSLHLVAYVYQDREIWELSEFDWFQKNEKPDPPRVEDAIDTSTVFVG